MGRGGGSSPYAQWLVYLTAYAILLGRAYFYCGWFENWSFMPVMRSSSVAAILVTNATSPQQVVRGIDVIVDARESRRLVFSYTVVADLHRLLIPMAEAPRRVDELWKHTCFEAFFGMKGSATYYEFNFSPSRQWAAYGFGGYRVPGPMDLDWEAPRISVEETTDRLTLTAAVRFDRLPLIRAGAALRIGLSAVMEAADGALSYWALKHPSDKPDFHHPDSFVLEVTLPDGSA